MMLHFLEAHYLHLFLVLELQGVYYQFLLLLIHQLVQYLNHLQ